MSRRHTFFFFCDGQCVKNEILKFALRRHIILFNSALVIDINWFHPRKNGQYIPGVANTWIRPRSTQTNIKSQNIYKYLLEIHILENPFLLHPHMVVQMYHEHVNSPRLINRLGHFWLKYNYRYPELLFKRMSLIHYLKSLNIPP